MKRRTMNETGAAAVQLTPPAAGAVGVVRVEGRDAAAKLAGILRYRNGTRGAPQAGRHRLARLAEGDETIDEVIVVRCGETAFDICMHGGVGVMEAAQSFMEKAGFRRMDACAWLAGQIAEGRLSLLEAEEMLALAACRTERQARALAGAGRALQREAEELLASAADDDEERQRLPSRLAALLSRARHGVRLQTEGRVVIAGPVNAGKSSLANALAREPRAIVSDRPGTTRDVVDRRCAIRGLPVVLTDTAGLRTGAEGLEADAAARAASVARPPAVVVLVLDGGLAPSAEIDDLLRRTGVRPAIRVVNKADLPVEPGHEGMRVSALTGAGIDALELAIEKELTGEAPPPGPEPFVPRQEALIDAAAAEPGRAAQSLERLLGRGLTRDDALMSLNDQAGREKYV
jgi:tRNA modification GTPase